MNTLKSHELPTDRHHLIISKRNINHKNESKTCLQFSKQSFDRFCDDLCQLLLSFLSIEEKIQFQCVSKQWQRLIFNGQTKLLISGSESNGVKNLLTKSKQYKHLFVIKKPLLEVLLQKFKFINEIVIDNYCIIDGQIIRSIGDNCVDLERFVCTSIKINELSESDLRLFATKCGQTLTFIQFDGINDMQMQNIVRLTPNIRSVNIQNNKSITQNHMVFIDSITKQLLSPKLQTIYISCYSVDDLMAFADKYSRKMKRIQIKFTNNYLSANAMNNALKELSRFINLEALSLLIYNHQKAHIWPIDDGLKMIGIKCSKLKHFVCEMTQNLISGQLFEVFGNFRALKTCKISTTYENLCDYGSISCLKNCQHLSHLTLYLKYLSDKHLRDINVFLPKLTSFKVNTSNGHITDDTFHYLAKLDQLSTVEISGISSAMINITDAGICDTLINCPKVKSISLFCKTSVTQITVDQFIKTAKMHPKTRYKFFYESDHSDQSQNTIDCLPHNLSIYEI